MKILGIITEYNPFHNGHAIHVKKSKQLTNSDIVIAVMSGNFVQRGEPAIIDKYKRTEMALKNGVDLVLELPLCFATASAEYFAQFAVSILNAAGIIDCICFGSESENSMKNFYKMHELFEKHKEKFNEELKFLLSCGKSYATASLKALESLENEFPKELLDIMRLPNNMLGFHYLQTIKKLNSKIEMHVIKREQHLQNDYSAENENNAVSAKEIREKAFLKKNVSNYLPKTCLEILEASSFYHIDRFSDMLHYKIVNESQNLKDVMGCNEDLANRIIKFTQENYLISEIVTKVQTRRYKSATVKRVIMHYILGINKSLFNDCYKIGPEYIRILGFKKEKAFLIKLMKQKSTLPIVTNLKHAKKNLNEHALYTLSKEIQSTDIFNLSCIKNDNLKSINYEYSSPLVII